MCLSLCDPNDMEDAPCFEDGYMTLVCKCPIPVPEGYFFCLRGNSKFPRRHMAGFPGNLRRRKYISSALEDPVFWVYGRQMDEDRENAREEVAWDSFSEQYI